MFEMCGRQSILAQNFFLLSFEDGSPRDFSFPEGIQLSLFVRKSGNLSARSYLLRGRRRHLRRVGATGINPMTSTVGKVHYLTPHTKQTPKSKSGTMTIGSLDEMRAWPCKTITITTKAICSMTALRCDRPRISNLELTLH